MVERGKAIQPERASTDKKEARRADNRVRDFVRPFIFRGRNGLTERGNRFPIVSSGHS
jgi:hypothetical protein